MFTADRFAHCVAELRAVIVVQRPAQPPVVKYTVVPTRFALPIGPSNKTWLSVHRHFSDEDTCKSGKGEKSTVLRLVLSSDGLIIVIGSATLSGVLLPTSPSIVMIELRAALKTVLLVWNVTVITFLAKGTAEDWPIASDVNVRASTLSGSGEPEAADIGEGTIGTAPEAEMRIWSGEACGYMGLVRSKLMVVVTLLGTD